MASPLHNDLTRLDSDRFATALLFLALGVVACLMPAQNDTWWLLRAGEEMWRSGRVMLHDEFTHTVAGQYWLNHEWLTEIVFYGLYQVGGLPLLTAFCAAAVMTAWVLIAQLTPGPLELRLTLISVGAALTVAGWSVRAQTLTLALFAVTLWILVRQRFVWALPVVFLVWANLHGAVATGGLLIVAAVLASAILARERVAKLLGIGVLCLIATTMTPLGLSFWLEIPTSMARAKAIGISEWRAPSLTNPADLPLWIAIVALGVLIVRRRRALWSWEALMPAIATGFLLWLALQGTRNIALFTLCAVPTAAALLTQDGSWTRHRNRAPSPSKALAIALGVSTLACGGVVAYAWSIPLARLGWQPLPAEMTTAITNCEGPLYNRYDEGGYIMWFVKGRRVFMDSRQDPFPAEMVLDQIRLEATGEYEPTFRRYGITCALTPEGSPLSQRLKQDGWSEAMAGPGWRVFSSASPKTPSSQ